MRPWGSARPPGGPPVGGVRPWGSARAPGTAGTRAGHGRRRPPAGRADPDSRASGAPNAAPWRRPQRAAPAQNRAPRARRLLPSALAQTRPLRRRLRLLPAPGLTQTRPLRTSATPRRRLECPNDGQLRGRPGEGRRPGAADAAAPAVPGPQAAPPGRDPLLPPGRLLRDVRRRRRADRAHAADHPHLAGDGQGAAGAHGRRAVPRRRGLHRPPHRAPGTRWRSASRWRTAGASGSGAPQRTAPRRRRG